MSGDVQPRKRKDKRRKKEGGSLGSAYEPEIIHKHKKSESDHKSFELPDQGEKIHVQNEHGVGGNICVKIIFFCLFGLLVGAVGLIYLQSQGSTDVDLPTVEESRFAEYFTGWLDDSNDDHEHGELEQEADEHDELEDHDEHEEHEEHEDDDHEKEDQSAEQESIFSLFGLNAEEEKDEPEESEMTTSDARESEESGIKDDEDEDEDLDKEEDEDDDIQEDNEDEEQIDDKDDEEDVEQDSEDEVEEDEELDNKDDEDSGIENDEDDASQVDENEDEDESGGADNEKDVEQSEEDEDVTEAKEQNDESEEADDEKEEDEEEPENEKPSDDLGYDEIYESEEEEISKQEEAEETSEGIEKEEVEEEEEKATFIEVESSTKDEEDESPEEESGGVAVKLGVGIALVIVAHLVLVQKWKSMSDSSTDEMSSCDVKPIAEEKKTVENLTSDIEPVISRRQTLVPENVSLNDEWGEDEEEEEEIDEEVYSEDEEVEEEEIKKSTHENLESFEELSWNEKKEKEDYEDDVYNEEEEEEEVKEEGEDEIEEEEEEEEAEDDREEEYEEEDVENEEEDYDEEEEEMENEYERKKPYVGEVDPPREEVIQEEAQPVPPPRSHKGGRGPQDFEEDFMERFEGISEVEEKSQDEIEGDELENGVEPEEPKPVEKVGSEDDWAFKQEFDFADEQFENNPKAAVEAFDKILARKPTVVRALIGRARALDHLAEKEKSNLYLKKAISAYKSLLLEYAHLLDDDTFVKLSERCIERIRFSGGFSSAIDIHKALIMKFPQTPKYRNALAVTYLMLNRIPQARVLLNETLALWPDDGFALVHYGFILKTSDNNMEEGAKKLMAGIETKQEGVIDGMFFFHLGDALNRLGRGHEAMKWYELGVKEGLFLSKYQRSLYNVNRLKGQPWWTKEETTYQDFFRKLEQNWREIRREGLELLNSKGVNLFKQETENLKDTGDWKQLDLYFRGKKQATCNKAPITCGLVSAFKPAATCTRGQIKFSVMLPETHVWPHCGPTNCRLRSHLGLVVPKKTYIRVAEETRSWEEGKLIVFDDSFEHEVWHNGTGLRLVLIVDVWHPELTNHERLTLSPI